MINENGCKVYTVKDIQEMLKISRTAAYKLINSNQFPIVRIGRSVRVPKEGFNQWSQVQCNNMEV